MTGLILKGVGGFYTVLADGEEHICRAGGRMRKAGLRPVPGDTVEFLPEDGYMTEVRPRRNSFVRPAVANVDKLVIVLSASVPKPDLLLTDKLLIQCAASGIAPVLVINKCDSADSAAVEGIMAEYAPVGCPMIEASARTGEGLSELKAVIAGSICCFAGQSAVGKSSILNSLIPELELPVGELSAKTERGKHTTRHGQLWQVWGGAVMDTPGFSLLELAELDPERLFSLYPESREAGACRYPSCLHLSEPGCGVKPLLNDGRLSRGRYERYKLLLDELIDRRKNKYD